MYMLPLTEQSTDLAQQHLNSVYYIDNTMNSRFTLFTGVRGGPAVACWIAK